MNRISVVFISFCIMSSLFTASACKSEKKHPMLQKIEEITLSKQAKVGVAVIGYKNGREFFEFNGDQDFPMQSVYKFPLALAIMDKVDKKELFLDQEFLLFRALLHPGMYSPMLLKYQEPQFRISLSELLRYSLGESDNVACDLLFSIAGGTEKVNEYIQNLGIEAMSIATIEAEMHQDMNKIFFNLSTPGAAALLLEKFYSGNILSPQSREFLLKIMYETTTGPDRLKALLPPETFVYHKTGTGPWVNDSISACNDIGIIVPADKSKYFIIAVFITASNELDGINSQMIAEISKAAYDIFG